VNYVTCNCGKKLAIIIKIESALLISESSYFNLELTIVLIQNICEFDAIVEIHY
jgi:hypothetical protein